jgi:hypothetical protein
MIERIGAAWLALNTETTGANSEDSVPNAETLGVAGVLGQRYSSAWKRGTEDWVVGEPPCQGRADVSGQS